MQTLPCPFCRRDAVRVEKGIQSVWFVACDVCLAQGPLAESAHACSAAWNQVAQRVAGFDALAEGINRMTPLVQELEKKLNEETPAATSS